MSPHSVSVVFVHPHSDWLSTNDTGVPDWLKGFTVHQPISSTDFKPYSMSLAMLYHTQSRNTSKYKLTTDKVIIY